MTATGDKCIISCALTGVLTNPKQHPFIPVTPDEMAMEAKRAADQGASIVHCHFRDQREGKGFLPTWNPEVASSIVDAIREKVPGMIINMSTGVMGDDISEPVSCLQKCKPEIAALNAGSLNYLKIKRDGTWAWPPMLFDNSIEKISKFIDAMNLHNVIPECECFDTGIVRSVAMFEQNKMLKKPLHVSFVMGVASGMPADADLLPILIRQLPKDSHFQTITIGRSDVWAVHKRSAELGGDVRTGLEDTFYLPNGEKVESNGTLIEALAKVVRSAGCEVASIEEARQRLFG